jgi:DNA-directed RNA polymerase subunit H (RpoH/RPB5)
MSQNSSSTISSIYKARNTIIKMMSLQGYNVDEYENFSVNEVNAMYQTQQLDMLLEKKNEKTGKINKIYITFYLGKSLRDKNIQEIIDDLFNLEEILTHDDTLMIITKDDINDTITNLLKHIWEQENLFIVIQNIKRLQFNILEHSLVPPHKVLNNEELDEVKRRYNITNNKEFPDISRFDPVAQVIGIRPGQVCEITRPSKTAIEGLYYRICI